MIIVSFETPDKKTFQGALLQTEKYFPVEPFAAKIKENNPRDYKLDSYFNKNLENRHTYFKEKKPNHSKFSKST